MGWHFLGGFFLGWNISDSKLLLAVPFITFWLTDSLGWAFVSYFTALFIIGALASYIGGRIYENVKDR